MSQQPLRPDTQAPDVATGDSLELYCPIPLTFHPKAQEVQNRSFDWMERFKLFGDGTIPRENALATESARVTGSMIPDAPEDLLLLYVTYMYWGFMVDDLVDAGTAEQRSGNYRALAPQLMRVLESPLAEVPDASPVIALFRDMRRFVAEHATAAQTRLWVDGFQVWLIGVALELDDARTKSLPGLDEYLFVKMYSGTVRAVTITVEICGGGGELPAEERESPAVTALTQAAGVLMNLYADLFSHGKETPDDHNIINVIIREDRCDRQQARARAVELCDRIMVLFLSLRDRTVPGVSPATRVYLDNLASTLSGVLDWCGTVTRFKTGADGVRTVRTQQPAHSDHAAPPYPNIAWWWSQLD